MGDFDSLAGGSGGFSASMKSQASNATLRQQKTKDNLWNQKPKSILETVPVHGPRVIENNEDFHEFADTLDRSISTLLKGQEDDFYIVFRAHMYTVMKQIWDLRRMAEYQEEKTAKDCRIRNVERELEWFMTEALRLDHLAKITTKECETWRAKASALEQKKRIHSNEVKGHKKVNKVLNLAGDHPSPSYSPVFLTSPSTGSQSARGSPQKQQLVLASKANDSCSPSKKMPVVSPQSARSTSAVPSPQVSPSRPSILGSSPSKKSGALSARGAGSSPPLADEREQWYVDTIRELQDKLKKQQRETRLLKASRSGAFARKSYLEEFFLKCVSEARKDLDRGQRLFTERERERCDEEKMIETLLASENAMTFIYEQMFPHRVGMTRHLMAGDRHLGLVSSEIFNSAKQKTLPPLE